jgi:hypothetical protein
MPFEQHKPLMADKCDRHGNAKFKGAVHKESRRCLGIVATAAWRLADCEPETGELGCHPSPFPMRLVVLSQNSSG